MKYVSYEQSEKFGKSFLFFPNYATFRFFTVHCDMSLIHEACYCQVEENLTLENRKLTQLFYNMFFQFDNFNSPILKKHLPALHYILLLH